MRILVTGGAGFVGSTFVRHTLAGRYPSFSDSEILVLDKLTYAAKLDNLAPVDDDPRLRLVQGDVCDTALVEELLKGVSTVIHCAAETHVDRSITDGATFVRSNVLGTHNLLDQALQSGVERFVLVSTDEVYGSTEGWPATEQYPLQPNSPYSASKGAADLLARAYWATHGLPVATLRCVNNYGPYQFPEKLIPLFITNLLMGEKVPLYGDGRNMREWIHVDDHCRAIARVAEHGQGGEVYNIGGSVQLTNIQVTEKLLEAVGSDWDSVFFVEDRKGHDRSYSLNGSKASTDLDFRPEVDFDEGIAATVKWYRENRGWWEPMRKEAPSLV